MDESQKQLEGLQEAEEAEVVVLRVMMTCKLGWMAYDGETFISSRILIDSSNGRAGRSIIHGTSLARMTTVQRYGPSLI